MTQGPFHRRSSSINRRRWLASGTAAGLSTVLGGLMAQTAQAKERVGGPAGSSTDRRRPRYKRCVTLWMQGGPSQLDTVDPKPGTTTGGPFSAVSTRTPDVHFCETLSDLALRTDDLCLIRSVASRQGEHDRASHLLHTGFEKIDSFPRPALGSYVANGSGDEHVPGFVTLGEQIYGPAFLGTSTAPFVVQDLDQTTQTMRSVAQRRNHLDAIGMLNERFARHRMDPLMTERSRRIDAIRSLVHSPFAEAFDVSQENASTRARYGETDFGRRVLAARRLLQRDVRYVEVQMPGWDTHIDNFRAVENHCRVLQPAWIALMDDLKSTGLWEDTLVIWMGEFGRTPTINGQRGRDHYPDAIPVVLAGHDLGGRVIGSTGNEGTGRSDPQHSVADLMYSLMTLLGVDADAEYTTEFDSPTTATDDGRLIQGLG